MKAQNLGPTPNSGSHGDTGDHDSDSGVRQDGPVELVRSKQRVADHGEVFTPPELVEAMLDLVRRRGRAHRLPLPGAGVRLRQLPRAGPAAQARDGRRPLRQERLREAPPRAAGPDVHLRHRAARRQRRRVPREPARRSSPTTSASSERRRLVTRPRPTCWPSTSSTATRCR